MTIPIIETSLLLLRPLHVDDFEDFYEYAQDPLVSSQGMWSPYESKDSAREDFNHICTLYDRGLMWWALEDHTSGKMVGRCELADYDPRDSHAELSYALHRDFWGRGYMTDAAQMVVRYGFEQLQLIRIGAQVFPDNLGSIRVLEKIGMTQEGRLRHYSQVRGKPDDVYIYSVLRTEWQAQ